MQEIKIVRKLHLAEKVVFIDGLPGCGKTLFSFLLSAFDRVEKINYSYEIEQLCSLYHLKKIELDAVVGMVKMLTDLIVYDIIMSRNVNCRPSDLSSIFRHPNKLKYIKRFFLKGDMSVPDRIQKEKPILPLTVHNLLGTAGPIFKALEERVVFLEIVRHPLYMIIQQALNNERLVFTARHFNIYFNYGEEQMPWYALGWESEFLNANPVEKAILFIEKMGKNLKDTKSKINSQQQKQILTIPFENFVINPDGYMTDIENLIGWVPPKEGLTEKEELDLRRNYALENTSPKIMLILDKLCTEYEEKYLGGVIISKNGYKE